MLLPAAVEADDLGRTRRAAPPAPASDLYLRDRLVAPLDARGLVRSGKDGAGIPGHRSVLGVAVRGHARAYPLRMLAHHAVVNDRIGNADVFIVYDAVGGLMAAFERPEGIDLRAAGYYRGTLLLRGKTRQGKDFLWSPYQRDVIAGTRPRDFGDEITTLVATTWEAWRQAHAQTTVVVGERRLRDSYYQPRGGWIGSPVVPPALRASMPPADGRLPAHAVVACVEDPEAVCVEIDPAARKPLIAALSDSQLLVWVPQRGGPGRAHVLSIPNAGDVRLVDTELHGVNESERYDLFGRSRADGADDLVSTPARLMEWYAWHGLKDSTRVVRRDG